MKTCVPLLTAGALLLGAAVASSTTIIPPTFDELVSKADTIFVSRVVDRRAEWEFSRDGRAIVTVVTFDVERVLKGSLGLRTQLTFLGGTIGDLALQIADMPEFKPGDRDILFVSADARAVSPLIGLSHGRFRIVHDPARGVEEVRTHDGRPLAATGHIGQTLLPSLQALRAMAFTDFESAVRQRVSALRAR